MPQRNATRRGPAAAAQLSNERSEQVRCRAVVFETERQQVVKVI